MSANDPRARIWWHEVPPADEQRWQAAFAHDGVRLDLGVPCPVCGARTLHRFFGPPPPNRPPSQPSRRIAGLWEWCSTCRSYRHISARYPTGYAVELAVDGSRAGHDPDAIEEARLARAYRDVAAADADERSIRALDDPDTRAARLADFAAALAAAGQGDRAVRVVRSIAHPLVRARAFDLVATNLTRRGHPTAARDLLGEAEGTAAAIETPWRQALALARIAAAYAEAAEPGDAARVREEAIGLARRGERSGTGDEREAASRTLAELAEDMAQAGQAAEARALARSIAADRWRELALNAVGRVARRRRRVAARARDGNDDTAPDSPDSFD